MTEAQYLGDGLYFQDDMYQVRLFTDRAEVFLDPAVLLTFIKRLESSRGLKITIEKAPNDKIEINKEA